MADKIIEATFLPNHRKVWEIENGLYATMTWISPKKELHKNIYAYFVTLTGEHLMDEGGIQYAVLSTADGEPINLSADFVLRG